MKLCQFTLLIVSILASPVVCIAETSEEPAWTKAHLQGPLDADQTRQFMRDLARFVFENHLKRDAKSPQRGMVYEYFDVSRRGQFDQFIQGEGLDTMHDGAWLAAAMVNAYRATGDEFYKQFLTEWQLPFYLKMLNHSDELFTARRNDARPGSAPWGRAWAYQEGEKGFVPYFWDDGGSVSLDRRSSKNPLGSRPCVDLLAGKPNPEFLLSGYSQGMSNHMSQDLGVMLQQAWLLLKDSTDPADKHLAAETAQAARSLHECRMRHFGHIPMCVAPAALCSGDAELMKRVRPANSPEYWTPNNHYTRALAFFKPGQRMSLPGFADDQQYRYYYGIAQSSGQVSDPLAFKTIYDAYTEPLTYRYYSDDAPVPAGINRFDLHGINCRDGKLEDYRSDRKGPYGGPRPIGSRFGPQNMICCGWALQMFRGRPNLPDIWTQHLRREFPDDLRVYVNDPPPGADPTSVPLATVHFDEASVGLASTRSKLQLTGSFSSDSLTLRIYDQPEGKGDAITVTLNKNGTANAVNSQGQKLLVKAGPAPKLRAGVSVSVSIPYMVTKGQKAWLTGIEHGRYSIGVGGKLRNFYLLSDRRQVQARLEHELGAGLRTWRAIFDELGYIPTGLNTSSRWANISDSGGYAHLISAAAQWLLCLEGRRDWEQHNVPQVGAKTN